jgi:hypothetical protein
MSAIEGATLKPGEAVMRRTVLIQRIDLMNLTLKLGRQ